MPTRNRGVCTPSILKKELKRIRVIICGPKEARELANSTRKEIVQNKVVDTQEEKSYKCYLQVDYT